MKVTAYDDINQVLNILSKEVKEIFDTDLIGFYLTGSLSYDDFKWDRSDIDLLVVLKKAVSEEQFEKLKSKYQKLKISHPKWAERLECSYISIDILKDILPPLQPRPYYGEGELYLSTYGNEWLINNYLLYTHGVALIGPDFKTLAKPINIQDVQKACVRDLFKEWEPKIIDPEWLKNSHYQSYAVLNVCRILYTVMSNEAASKKVSAEWVKNEFPQWRKLIETAENWKYGIEMTLQDKTKEFIRFVIGKVKEKRL
ncbi:MAG: DUF4111 domain-containing protein [bacterium]|nr:DUF4111 domain-containing protein [bacterium]